MTRSEATRIALENLEQAGSQSACELALLEDMTIERGFGWVFFYQSKRYLQSGNFSDVLCGNAPILVAKTDGRIHVMGTARPLEHYLTQLAATEGWNIEK